jgi:Ni/Fe-hydrogenase subunit HybB-like protein
MYKDVYPAARPGAAGRLYSAPRRVATYHDGYCSRPPERSVLRHGLGRLPEMAPSKYSGSIFEWGISVGLITKTILLFALGARLMPALPKEEPC